MKPRETLIFIDANQYLEFYRVIKGKRLLGVLSDLQEYIFVTTQVAEEVQRNKLRVAASFLDGHLKKLKFGSLDVDLFDASSETTRQLRKRLQVIDEDMEKVRPDLSSAAAESLDHISRSEDQVSKALDPIFRRATTHSEVELHRARDRKERGNPPGKRTDALGDQLSWEQLLTECSRASKLWLITQDSDYCLKSRGRLFLNPLLYREIIGAHPSLQIFFFDNIDDGLRDFVRVTGKDTKKLPSTEESEAIKQERESLPPLDWLTTGVHSSHIEAITVDSTGTRVGPRIYIAEPIPFWQNLGSPPVLIKESENDVEGMPGASPKVKD